MPKPKKDVYIGASGRAIHLNKSMARPTDELAMTSRNGRPLEMPTTSADNDYERNTFEIKKHKTKRRKLLRNAAMHAIFGEDLSLKTANQAVAEGDLFGEAVTNYIDKHKKEMGWPRTILEYPEVQERIGNIAVTAKERLERDYQEPPRFPWEQPVLPEIAEQVIQPTDDRIGEL